MRLIDGNALIGKARWMEEPDGNGINCDILAVSVCTIEEAPTVDAVEVVHGRWEQGDMYDYGDVCSVCDWDSAREPCKLRYCPNCGAKMDGDGNGTT